MSLKETYNSRKTLMASILTQKGLTATSNMGLTTLINKISQLPSINNNTRIIIDVPLNIIYSDEFNITGYLTDSSNIGIINQQVELKLDDTIIDTVYTNNNGKYIFNSCPVTTGNHSFQVIFEGAGGYTGSTSAIINREVNRETSVLSLTNGSNITLYEDTSITLTGTLLSDDGEPIPNASVTIYDENDDPVEVMLTGNDGGFTGTLASSDLQLGENDLTVVFAGDTSYTDSTFNLTATLIQGNFTLTTSATSDTVGLNGQVSSSTVTGVLLNNGDPVSGDPVVVTVKDSSNNIIDTDTLVTSNIGEVSYTYTAAARGDVSIIMECRNLQETYVLTDVSYYDPMLSSNNDWSTVNGSLSLTYGSGGCEFKGTTGGTPNECDLDYTPTGDYQLECIISSVYFDSSSYNATAMIIVAGVRAGWTSGGSNLNVWDNSSHDIYYQNYSMPTTCKFVVEGNSVKLYLNSNLISTFNKQSNVIGVEAYNYRAITIKDLKITEL